MRDRDDDQKPDMIDDDLYEEIDDEELYELIQEEKRKAWERERIEKEERKSKRPFPRWLFYLIAIMMVTNIVAVLPNTFSIPAIDFLVTSAKLSNDADIDRYQEAVVVVEAGQKKGTGFAIDGDGTIITNHHVIEGENRISIAFPEKGLFNAEVVEKFPEVDLAVLQAEGSDFPHLRLAKDTSFEEEESFYFIGNPLRFTGIANKGTIIGYTTLDDWSQPVLMLDAPIYRGNSGSPVINQEGKVIAVVFATLDDEQEGRVGLATPIDYYYEKTNEEPLK
ncbi:serine protease [Halobacillus shinanisalinarum]|uniref:Serine protease n=1 Tax=Halobacillus shinanisalinarum TaxID=2932258 RepID=A0ABY4GXC7_9BACI|nr:serine protease [Halobacillus shinanisalinarum]UOQ92671.1 serine protease [Halobacillus shinanisalinarum]